MFLIIFQESIFLPVLLDMVFLRLLEWLTQQRKIGRLIIEFLWFLVMANVMKDLFGKQLYLRTISV